MIVSCPDCTARMQIKFDRERLQGKRVTIRCARCRHVFKTEIAPAPASSRADGKGELHVLVAHSDRDFCEAVASILTREGISFEVRHDGVGALQSLDAQPAQVALMDVALPGLYGFEVVDKVRQRPGLEAVKIILLSSVYNKAAYKRTPATLYGADDYLEKHHVPDRLISKIRELSGGAASGPSTESSSDAHVADGGETAFRDEMNTKIREADANETRSAGGEGEIDKARRLARIIVSDIALYNQEKVEAGVRDGNFYDVLKDEIGEGERLYVSRVSDEVRAHGDFLKEAFQNFIARRASELA